MAIFGISFGDFGSRKLKINSQKREEINFDGKKKSGHLMKYAPPENPDKKQITIDKIDLLNPDYEILTPYLVVPFSPKPLKTKNTNEILEPPLIKYGFPPES